jgi:hypothetical protein
LDFYQTVGAAPRGNVGPWNEILSVVVVPLEKYDGGHPAPDGASPTQPYKCGQNVKIKTALNGAGDRGRSPLRDGVDVDFDFNILTAFIRLGRAGPEGAGCPPILKGLGRVPSIFIGIVPSIIIGIGRACRRFGDI